jgi:DNA-binding MarR family transcriptional regulator
MPEEVQLSHRFGYWLRRVDSLIEATQKRTFAEEQLNRREWQILHLLSESPRDAAGLLDALRPFLGPGAITLDEVTGELSSRGWLTRDEVGRYALTAAGKTGHAAVEEKLDELFRSTFLAGLTPDDYYGTMRILQRMAENLEQAAEDPRTGPTDKV